MLGKGSQCPPQPLTQAPEGHTGTPVTTPGPHTTKGEQDMHPSLCSP